jgi:hypothetical protein
MNKKAWTENKQIEARKALIENYKLKPDDTLLIVIKSVSSSGMCRRMRVLMPDNRDISWLIAELCDLSINSVGLKITGCGMNMCFWLADHITYCLYGKALPKDLKGNGGNCIAWVSI